MAFPFMFGRISFFLARGQTSDAIALAQRFIAVAEQMSDDAARVVGQRLAAMAYFQVGDLPKARENVERSLAGHLAERDEAATQRFGQDIHLHSRCLLSVFLFFQGEVDRSLQLMLGTLQIAEERDHAHTTALALSYAGLVVGFSGEPKSLAAVARRLGEVSERHGLGAIGLLEQAIVESEASGTSFGIVRYLTLLADARRRSGQLEEARAAYSRATQLFSADSKCFQPELFRVGALISRDLNSGRSKEAEELFERAISSARDVGVPLFELRALLDFKTLGTGAQSDLDARIVELAAVSDVVQRAEAAVRAHARALQAVST
jgi:tetratricopeptide (TPR) repeat protein